MIVFIAIGGIICLYAIRGLCMGIKHKVLFSIELSQRLPALQGEWEDLAWKRDYEDALSILTGKEITC